MDLPTRTKQKKAESLSYAILLYKLRHVGIFRNVTDNDYGIDFEVELVDGESVTGAYFKAQVKAADGLPLRGSEKVPVVGGIKQSTLHYWCRLSYRSHVIAYAVDIPSETIYLSEPVFWAATQLIDGSGASKSLDFVPAHPHPDPNAAGKMQETAVALASFALAQRPQASEQIQAIRTALRYLGRFLRQREDAHGRDYSTELPDVGVFETLLDVCKILLIGDAQQITAAGLDPRTAYNLDWWILQFDINAEEVASGVARRAYDTLLPLLIDRLATYRDFVLKGGYYWLHTDPKFLQLVHETMLPTTDEATLDAWGADYDQARARARESFASLCNRIETDAIKAKADRDEKLKARKYKKTGAVGGAASNADDQDLELDAEGT